MIDSVKKSLNSILYERTTSPFYGTLVISWLIWNWKIIYLTLFISENKLSTDKITYITKNLSSSELVIVYPLISTLVILTLIPFLSNGSFWINLKFEKWKKEKLNEVEQKQLLTLEQSIEIREQIINQESRFETLLKNKNVEIKQLNAIIEELKNDAKISNQNKNNDVSSNLNFEKLIKNIKSIDKDFTAFQKMLELMQTGYQVSDRGDIPSKLITLLEINDIIETKGRGVYGITKNGKELTKLIFN